MIVLLVGASGVGVVAEEIARTRMIVFGLVGLALAATVAIALCAIARVNADRGREIPGWPWFGVAGLLLAAVLVFAFLPARSRLPVWWLCPAVTALAVLGTRFHIPLLSPGLILFGWWFSKLVLAGTGRSLPDPRRHHPWLAGRG